MLNSGGYSNIAVGGDDILAAASPPGSDDLHSTRELTAPPPCPESKIADGAEIV